jgi:hypothetical protein
MTRKLCGQLAVTASFVLALVMPLTTSAQEEENQGPVWMQVRSVSLNADGVQKWVELQRQTAEANRENDAPHRHVWQEVRGSLDTFHIVSFNESLAELDPQGENGAGGPPADWIAAITPTVRERSQTINRRHRNLAIPAAEDYEPNLLVLSATRIRQGKVGDYHDWIENKFKPALEAAGMTGVYFSHQSHGGQLNVCMTAVHLENWARLDQRLLPDLTGEERAAVFGGLSEIVAGSERRILRYRADMSN